MDRRAAPVVMQSDGAAGAWTLDVRAQALARATMAHASPALQEVVRAGNWWGGPGVIYAGAVTWLAARALSRSRLAMAGFRGVESLAAASAISAVIKGLAGRSRPFVAPAEPWHFDFAHGWSDARYFSLPSGHVTATAAFACGVWFGMQREPVVRRVIVAAMLGMSAIWVAMSRVASDQHWTSDTLVGAALGALVSVVIAQWRAGRTPSRYDRVVLGAAASTEIHA